MSGAVSIPFAFFALFWGKAGQKEIFTFLAFAALWVLAIRLAMEKYQLMEKLKSQEDQLQSHNILVMTEFVGHPNKLSSANEIFHKCSKCGQGFKIPNPIFRAAKDCIQTAPCPNPKCKNLDIVGTPL